MDEDTGFWWTGCDIEVWADSYGYGKFWLFRNVWEERRRMEYLWSASGRKKAGNRNTGEIVEVEKGESDIMLELILELFDYLFIKPKQQEQFLKKIEEKYGIKP